MTHTLAVPVVTERDEDLSQVVQDMISTYPTITADITGRDSDGGWPEVKFISADLSELLRFSQEWDYLDYSDVIIQEATI